MWWPLCAERFYENRAVSSMCVAALLVHGEPSSTEDSPTCKQFACVDPRWNDSYASAEGHPDSTHVLKPSETLFFLAALNQSGGPDTWKHSKSKWVTWVDTMHTDVHLNYHTHLPEVLLSNASSLANWSAVSFCPLLTPSPPSLA